jgi:hypothetical protein
MRLFVKWKFLAIGKHCAMKFEQNQFSIYIELSFLRYTIWVTDITYDSFYNFQKAESGVFMDRTLIQL